MVSMVSAPAPELLLRSPDATWNAERWEQIGDDGNRYEVLDGVLYMSTAPSPAHQMVIRQSQREMYRQIDDRGIGITLGAPIGLFMPGADPVQPDILVLHEADRARIGRRRITCIPALIVEVLSPSNADYDLVIKRGIYARAGVPEYVIMRPSMRDLLVHTRPEPATGQYLQVTTLSGNDEYAATTLPFRANVATFFAELPEEAE
jgi:Uma2 family endonuclease